MTAAPTGRTAETVGAPGGAAAVEARSLYRFFRAGDEETLALQGVSLAVEAGEFVVIAGPSGSGKSTLLSCLAGLDDPDGGTVRVGGLRLSHQPEPERARLRARSVGLLLQSGNLFDHLDLTQNIAMAQRLANRADRADPAALMFSLGIAARARARPQELSGGELARAGLAVALANNPVVLLADEPTGELDRGAEQQVLALLEARALAGVAIVVASHSRAVAAAADRIITLADGKASA